MFGSEVNFLPAFIGGVLKTSLATDFNLFILSSDLLNLKTKCSQEERLQKYHSWTWCYIFQHLCGYSWPSFIFSQQVSTFIMFFGILSFKMAIHFSCITSSHSSSCPPEFEDNFFIVSL